MNRILPSFEEPLQHTFAPKLFRCAEQTSPIGGKLSKQSVSQHDVKESCPKGKVLSPCWSGLLSYPEVVPGCVLGGGEVKLSRPHI